MKAKAEIHANAVLFSLEREDTVNTMQAYKSPLARAFASYRETRVPQIVLSLILIDAQRAGQPAWVADLPPHGADEIKTGLSFTAAEIESHFEGCREVLGRTNALQSMVDAAWGVIQTHSAEEKVTVTRYDLDHAVSIVLSRGFEVEISGDSHIYMLPVADMLNHHIDTVTRTSIQFIEGRFIIRVSIARGWHISLRAPCRVNPNVEHARCIACC